MSGYITGKQFFECRKDASDVLDAERQEGRAKVKSIDLHCRLIGRLGKLSGLERLIDYIRVYEDVWRPRRTDFALHLKAAYPLVCDTEVRSMWSEGFRARHAEALARAKSVAERAASIEMGLAHSCFAGVHGLLCRACRGATAAVQQAVGARF